MTGRTPSGETNEPAGQPLEPGIHLALHDLLVEATAKLEELRCASLGGQPIEEAASGGDLLELACLLGALTGGEAFCLAIAKHPGAPAVVLGLLAERESGELRIAVARNPRTPPQTLSALAESESTQLAVAGNPSAPRAVLSELAKHWDLDVRNRVIHNPSTPEVTRRELQVPPNSHRDSTSLA